MSSLGEIPDLGPSASRTGHEYDSSASSGQKRTRDGSPTQSAFFTTATKNMVRSRVNTEICWNCEAPNTQFAHVVARAEPAYKAMERKGMITIALSDYRNAITLCSNCHASFDRTSNTDWVYLPTDLQWFVDWEENDFTGRQTAFRQTGIRIARKFPDEQDYEKHMRATNALKDPDDGLCRGGLYNSYILERMFAPIMMEGLEQRGLRIPGEHPRGPKRWHGAPMAAINRGFVVTGAPWMRLPEPVWELLRTLQRHYSRELPEFVASEAETGGQIGAASHVLLLYQQPTAHAPQAYQGASTSAKSAPAPAPAATADEQRHSARGQNALHNNDDFDSAIDLCPQELGRRKRREAANDDVCGNSSDYDLHQRNRKRQRLQTREREALGVCPDSWSYGPSSSSDDKIVGHYGRKVPSLPALFSEVRPG